MRTVTVKSGNYPVRIGPGLLKEAGERIAQAVRGKRCAVVTDDRVGPLYAKPLVSLAGSGGHPRRRPFLPHGEQHKTLETFARAVAFFAERELTRADFAGGAGRRRGRRPDRLCGGLLHARHRLRAGAHPPCSRRWIPRSAARRRWTCPMGKNLVGAFHQPKLVLCDTDVIAQTAPAASARRRGGDDQVRRFARRRAFRAMATARGKMTSKTPSPAAFPSSATMWTRTSSTRRAPVFEPRPTPSATPWKKARATPSPTASAWPSACHGLPRRRRAGG